MEEAGPVRAGGSYPEPHPRGRVVANRCDRCHHAFQAAHSPARPFYFLSVVGTRPYHLLLTTRVQVDEVIG
jgi:hypothetical protein